MNAATVHPREGLLVDVPSGDDRTAGDIAAAQCFGERDDVWLEIPMLKSEHFPCATKACLHFIRDQQCAVFAAKFLSPREEIRFRRLAAFALNGLDHKGGDITRPKLTIELLDVVQRHARVESSHQWAESFDETLAAH